MSAHLSVLIVEDSESDAQLIVRMLKKADYDLFYEQVETAEQMRAALERHPWDIVISDYKMPQFSGIAALKLLQEMGRDIPFIITSGTIGEETAVAMMRAGAQDYLTKGNLTRLVPAVERELSQAEIRRKQGQINETLRASELRYQAVINSANDAIISADSAGTIVSWNPGAERIFGHTETEARGQSLQLLVPAGYQEGLLAGLARNKTGAGKRILGKTIELEGLRKDGCIFPLELSLSEWQGAEEKIYTAIIRDITERKQAEALMAQQSEQLRLVFEASQRLNRTLDLAEIYQATCDFMSIIAPNDGMFISSFDHETQLITCRAYSMDNNWLDVSSFPQVPLEPEGKGTQSRVIRSGQSMLINDYQALAKLVQTAYYVNSETNEIVNEIPEDEEITRSALIVPLKIGDRVSGVIQLVSYHLNAYNENQLKLLEAFALHIASAEQNARLYAQVQKELIERKEAEAALRESEERYHSLFDRMLDGIYRSTHAGRFINVNPAMVKMFGYASKEEMLEIDIIKELYYLPEERGSHVLDTGHGEVDVFRLRRKDGTEIWVEDRGTYIYDEQGQITHHEGIMRDVTKRVQTEESLRKSEAKYRELFNRMIDGFALHEIICDETGKPVDYRFLEINPAFERLTGLQSANLIGKTVLEVLPNTENYWIDTYGQTALSGQSAYFENYSKELDRHFEISVYCPRPGQFAVILVDISERKLADETVRQRVRELETLNRISLNLRTVSKQDEVLTIVLDEVLKIIDTPNGSIELWGGTGRNLRKAISRGWLAQIAEAPHNSEEGISGKVISSGEAYISREFASDPETRPTSRGLIPPGWGGICLPIRTTQQTMGVLIVSIPSERKLNTDEIRLLVTLSEMTGAAIQRMQLHDQTIRRLEQLKGLRTVEQAIASNFDMRLTLNILLSQTISQLGVDAADVLLLHPGSNLLTLASGRGFHTLFLESANLNYSFAGQTIIEHRPLMTLDFETAKKIPEFGKLWQEEGFVAYWCVPLIVKGEIKGVLEVYFRTAFTPNAEWLEFLQALAGQAAITIDNTQLFENLQRANTDLSLAYDATIEGWSRAMDLRDHETEGHTLRVTELTLKLARAMHINESQIINIRRGALLHDIGKMGVPDSILLKEGSLTDEEWLEMRKHPMLALDMLQPIAYLREALDIPVCHHEKWDGSGYPRGLKGEQIPLMARVFAIVDVWDALTNDRPYRKGWSKAKTIKYIREQSGKHFDPNIVDIFLNQIRKNRMSLPPAIHADNHLSGTEESSKPDTSKTLLIKQKGDTKNLRKPGIKPKST